MISYSRLKEESRKQIIQHAWKPGAGHCEGPSGRVLTAVLSSCESHWTTRMRTLTSESD
jgi:hypothetical protein